VDLYVSQSILNTVSAPNSSNLLIAYKSKKIKKI